MRKEASVIQSLIMPFGLAASLVLLLSLGLSASAAPSMDPVSTTPTPLVPGVQAAGPYNNSTGVACAAANDSPMCIAVYTGTVRSVFLITSPTGVSNFREYHLANFHQRVLQQTPTSLEIEITSRMWLDTKAPYPVDAAGLPADIRPYLSPRPNWIQSDNPEIVALAQSLVVGATRQTEAAEAIATWVRANIRWVSGTANDALSVLHNRQGVCAGFSALATALLRAAGIPARDQGGCALMWGWMVGKEGGGHAWIEVYYPDAGWVASDPQTTFNFVDTSHIPLGFQECGRPGTVISRTSHIAQDTVQYLLPTAHLSSIWRQLGSAHVTAWDRNPLRVNQNELAFRRGLNQTVPSRASVEISYSSCYTNSWWISTSVPWVTVTPAEGSGPATVAVSVQSPPNPTAGNTTAFIQVLGADWTNWGMSPAEKIIPIRLQIIERLYSIYQPLLLKEMF